MVLLSIKILPSISVWAREAKSTTIEKIAEVSPTVPPKSMRSPYPKQGKWAVPYVVGRIKIRMVN
jgi:hypothetical protein